MKSNSAAIGVILFSIFFLLGLNIGNSPIISGVKYAKETRKELNSATGSGLFVSQPGGYIIEQQYNQDIIHYDISVDLFPNEREIKGKTIITGRIIGSPADTVFLNFYDNMEISSLQFNGKSNKFNLSGTLLKIPLEIPAVDTFEIIVNYRGSPKRTGLASFVFGEINGHSLTYTLNEPNYASTWFPCSDRPDDKVMMDIHITNDSDKISVSNGTLTGITDNADGRKTYSWRTSYPISTYLISIYSSNYYNFTDHYISANKDTMLLDYYCLPKHIKEAKIDFGGHRRMIEIFSKLFGEYPFLKEKYGVAEFLWQLGAMEHQTITGIGSNFVSGKNFFEDIYVHELAHQWFGDAVGPKTWKDIWLNEGFASYSEALYYEALSGKKALRSTMISKFSSDYPGTLYNPKDLFNKTVYDKGAWTLHMLRKETGDSVFFKILRKYFETYKYSNASTDDFKTTCELISGKSFNKFFNQWVYNGIGIINCKYAWENSSNNELKINIEQTQENYEAYFFPLDLKIKFVNGEELFKTVFVDARKKTFAIEVNGAVKQIIPDPDNWLLGSFEE